ncbi:hypothetical protein chiPu_0011433 [Chiloscyllium punctatum]|uniref:Uncharacterized protein n=1 Tax=Chiloscyllium punctatum TaxID=137246 RepID=A0A401SRD9_CHIPU|nr:hypothetical protein [Chiloscyllium punctatum]
MLTTTDHIRIFLVTHLHAIPGHNNSSKNTSNLPLRDKWKKSPSQTFGCYKPKMPSQSTMNSDEIRKSLQAIFNDSNAAWAAESWMKLASEKDRQAVKKMIDYICSFSGKIAWKDTTGQSYISQALFRYIKPQFATSMIHWLQKAGREESTAMERLLRSLPSDLGYEQVQGPYFRLAKSARLWEMAPKPHSYDYQIHPEWVQAVTGDVNLRSHTFYSDLEANVEKTDRVYKTSPSNKITEFRKLSLSAKAFNVCVTICITKVVQ